MKKQSKELKQLFKKYYWLRSKNSKKFYNEVTITSIPPQEELEEFIKAYMLTVSRCLSINSYYWFRGSDKTLMPEDKIKETLILLHTLCIKYTPWQFHIMHQDDYSQFECSWTEADEQDPKYKED